MVTAQIFSDLQLNDLRDTSNFILDAKKNNNNNNKAAGHCAFRLLAY